MAARFYKVTGVPGSNGINSCPTVIGIEEDDMDVVVWGPELDSEAAAALPPQCGETGVRIPRSVLIDAARKLTENG